MAVFTLPAEKRLIALASSVINSYYPLKPDGWNPMPLQLTTFEIADITSSNRSTVSTIINQWVDKGLAKRDGSWLELHGKLFRDEYDWLNFNSRGRSLYLGLLGRQHQRYGVQITLQLVISNRERRRDGVSI